MGLAGLVHLQLEVVAAGEVWHALRCWLPARDNEFLFLPPCYATAVTFLLLHHCTTARAGEEESLLDSIAAPFILYRV